MTPLVRAERKTETIRAITRDLDAVIRDTEASIRGPLLAVLLRLRTALEGLDEALEDQHNEHVVRLGELRDDVEEALAEKQVVTGKELDDAVAKVSREHAPRFDAPGQCVCGSIYAPSDAYGLGAEEFRAHLAGSALDQVPADPLSLDDLLRP